MAGSRRIAEAAEQAQAQLDLVAELRAKLQRVPGERAADFYQRVADVYTVLETMSDQPTRDMHSLANPPGEPEAVTYATVASWIHRARKRGLLPEYGNSERGQA